METQDKERRLYRWLPSFRVRPGWEFGIFAGLALVALGLRLWELGGRTMHYDEAIHVHYAWRLAIGEGFSHSPWMHGPFQIHMTAFMFKLFSDSDFTARLGYVLFGSALVTLPYFLRSYLGRTGAVVTAVLLVLSPSLLYFSRFGRNEILMAFFAVALLTLMWRYLNEGKNRYLYMASAVLALAFATKESSYIIVAIFGAALLLLSLSEVVPWILGRVRLSDMRGAPVFLILLVTLTLPQWSAGTSLVQDSFGVVLASTEGGTGDVGLPDQTSPAIVFPLFALPLALNAFIAAGLVAVSLWLSIYTGLGRRLAKWLTAGGVMASVTYLFVSIPEGRVPRDFAITLVILFAFLSISVIIGVMWRWKVWLLCAGIFYFIWTLLYTSVFGLFVRDHGFCPGGLGSFFDVMCSKFGGLYTGSWQSLGYWLPQQDVARGGQPWYYHLVTGSLYEFVPLVFGVVAMIYFFRKGDQFGWMLGFWAILTLVAYTVASEKMPWLLVNIAIPFILLSGKFVGEIVEGINWRRVLPSGTSALLVLAPTVVVLVIYLLNRSLGQGTLGSWQSWSALAGIILIGAATVLLVKRARPRPSVGGRLAALGTAVLLLGFSSFVAFRASYNYDDSPIEMLAYAQGSADIKNIAQTLDRNVIPSGERERVVEVDRELWYPMNWYVRHAQKEGSLAFKCFKSSGEAGHNSSCKPLEKTPPLKAILLNESHASRDSGHLTGFEKDGPHRNLLWFPESYRRPGESRKREGFWEEMREDFGFVKENIGRREPWENALDYFLFRRLGSQWWDSKFYSFISSGPLAVDPQS